MSDDDVLFWEAHDRRQVVTPAPERPDPLDGLRRAVDRLNGIGADLHWRSVDDARRWSDGVNFFSRKADEYLAALVAAPVTDAEPDRVLADALLEWYDTTHGNDFGHDHHCPVPWASNAHTQEPDDRCTCGWSGVLRAASARADDTLNAITTGTGEGL